MKIQQSFSVVLLVGALLSSGVEGLQCYSCTNCGGNFLSNTDTCNDLNHFGVNVPAKCMTVTVGSEISRSCLASPLNGCASVVLGDVTTATCFCDTDLCNGGNNGGNNWEPVENNMDKIQDEPMFLSPALLRKKKKKKDITYKSVFENDGGDNGASRFQGSILIAPACLLILGKFFD